MNKIEINSAINAEARKVISKYDERKESLGAEMRQLYAKQLIDRAYAALRPLGVNRARVVHEIGEINEMWGN